MATETPPAKPGDSAPETPRADAGTEKRLADTQRWGHQLNQQLKTILEHPGLGPQARAILRGERVETPPTTRDLTPAEDAELQQAFEDYQKAPGDYEAFAHLVNTARRLGKADALAELQGRAERARTAQQVKAVQVELARSINATLQEHAPDVDLELFWRYASPIAQAETPPHLTGADRLNWQVARALELTREKQAKFTGPASAAAAEAERIRAGAAVVMPGGGSAPQPGAGPSPATQPVRFTDQVNAMRRARAGSPV